MPSRACWTQKRERAKRITLLNNSYVCGWTIHMHHAESISIMKKCYIHENYSTQKATPWILSRSKLKSVFLGVKHTVGNSHLVLTGFVTWFYWLPSVPITVQTLRPGPKEHVAWSRLWGRQCRNTFYALLAQMQHAHSLCGRFWVVVDCL